MDLSTEISQVPLVGESYRKKLKKLEISTVKDLLFHTPSRFLDFSSVVKVKNLSPGDYCTVEVEVKSAISQYSKRGVKMQIINLSDDTGSVNAIWFNQPYLLSTLKKGVCVLIAGRVEFFGRNLSFISPEYELKKSSAPLHTGRLVPVYSLTTGISSKWLRSRINHVIKTLTPKVDYLPLEIINEYNLPGLLESIKKSHLPDNLNEHHAAKRRLAFDEMFFIQLSNQKKKQKVTKSKAKSIKSDAKVFNEFQELLPFKLTSAQIKASKEILADLKKNYPMARLLQGDVGSGKTVVAASGAFAAFKEGYKSVFLAPTQILANQHFNTLKNIFKNRVRLSLVTATSNKNDFNKSGIIIGTHALLHKKKLPPAAFVVIDEQHRFGVSQREKLLQLTADGKLLAHTLNMTATPIPRTAALVYYGDQDQSVIDQLPKGRQKTVTWIVGEDKRKGAYEWISEQIIQDKIQVYIVCPLIEESDKETMAQVKAANTQYEYVKKLYHGRHTVELLHGKLKEREKNLILKKFADGRVDILVTTPVIEVGIDVPNATIMMIEAADRFGLSQLHQLRGRVGRGSQKSYCLLFATSEKENERLEALKKTHSGFELAEIDLEIRGQGEVYGVKQHGFVNLKNADWTDYELVKSAKSAAVEVINNVQLYNELMNKVEVKRN